MGTHEKSHARELVIVGDLIGNPIYQGRIDVAWRGGYRLMFVIYRDLACMVKYVRFGDWVGCISCVCEVCVALVYGVINKPSIMSYKLHSHIPIAQLGPCNGYMMCTQLRRGMCWLCNRILSGLLLLLRTMINAAVFIFARMARHVY